jgi:hypothetical protein
MEDTQNNAEFAEVLAGKVCEEVALRRLTCLTVRRRPLLSDDPCFGRTAERALLAAPEAAREHGATPPLSAVEKYRAKRKAETETGKARSEANSEQRDFHFDPMDAFRHKFD